MLTAQEARSNVPLATIPQLYAETVLARVKVEVALGRRELLHFWATVPLEFQDAVRAILVDAGYRIERRDLPYDFRETTNHIVVLSW